MIVGDLVCDPLVMKKYPTSIVNRTAGLVIDDEDNGNNYPRSYCTCGKNKYVVWWMKADIVYEQCECELESINEK
jgi:hypothetical protein